MPVQNMAWQWGWTTDDSATVSLEVNFAPTEAVALCSLSAVVGSSSFGTACSGGITQYRTLTQPDGAEQDHDFSASDVYGFPPMVYDTQITSVSAELLSGQQGTVMTLMIWLWR